MRERIGTSLAKRLAAMVRRRNRSPRRDDGFSLVELIAVLVIIAVTTSAVAISLSGHTQRIRVVRLLDRIERLDRDARATARRSHVSAVLRFDDRDGRVTVTQPQAGRAGATNRFHTGDGYTLELVAGLSGDKLAISPKGQSRSYALGVSGPNGGAQWLAVLGLTGQCVRCDSEEAARALVDR